MENDIFVKYDSLCMATLTNIHTLTKEHGIIAIKNFDWSNDEHKFVMGVIASCWGFLGEKKITVDGSWWSRRQVNKKYKRIVGPIAATDKKCNFAFDIQELLEYMRAPACELCGTSFRFGDIYHEYYEGDKA